MEPKLQTPSLSHKDGLGALGNWHGGRTQSLIPNRHWDFSLLSSFRGPLQPSEVAIKGGLRHLFLSQNDPFSPLTHSHIVVPQCPMALMGRDLLAKLQISINCPSLDPISILCIQMAPEPLASPHSQNLPLTDPQVWDSEASLVAHSPEQVFLKNPSGNNPNSIYPDHRILTKIKPIISRLLKASLLRPIVLLIILLCCC